MFPITLAGSGLVYYRSCPSARQPVSCCVNYSR